MIPRASRNPQRSDEYPVPPPRRRRTTAEVRSAILDAARVLFSQRGYGSTTTRDITAYAGVAEPLLFRHFGSKSQLFEQAVLDPFSNFVKQYATAMRKRSPGFASSDEAALDYLSRLHEFCLDNRQIALAIFMAASHEDVASELERAVSDLNTLFRVLETIARAESRRQGREMMRPALIVRLTFGLVLAVTVLDNWLFAGGTRRPGRQEMAMALADFVLYGVTGPRLAARD